MTGRHSTITAAQREEFWRRYKADEPALGIIGALGQRRANIDYGGAQPWRHMECS